MEPIHPTTKVYTPVAITCTRTLKKYENTFDNIEKLKFRLFVHSDTNLLSSESCNEHGVLPLYNTICPTTDKKINNNTILTTSDVLCKVKRRMYCTGMLQYSTPLKIDDQTHFQCYATLNFRHVNLQAHYPCIQDAIHFEKPASSIWCQNPKVKVEEDKITKSTQALSRSTTFQENSIDFRAIRP